MRKDIGRKHIQDIIYCGCASPDELAPAAPLDLRLASFFPSVDADPATEIKYKLEHDSSAMLLLSRGVATMDAMTK
jgi:hypothetical protein